MCLCAMWCDVMWFTFRWNVIFSYISPDVGIAIADEFDDERRSVSVAFFELVWLFWLIKSVLETIPVSPVFYDDRIEKKKQTMVGSGNEEIRSKKRVKKFPSDEHQKKKNTKIKMIESSLSWSIANKKEMKKKMKLKKDLKD